MTTIDIILIIFVSAFGVLGLIKGFVKSIGFLVGGVLSILLSARFYVVVSSIVDPFIKNSNLSNVVGFLVCLVVFSVGFRIIVELISKIFELPIINFANRMLGLAFGVVEGMLVVGTTLIFLSKYPPTQSFAQNVLDNSTISSVLIGVSGVLTPLMPNTLNEIPSTIKNSATSI